MTKACKFTYLYKARKKKRKKEKKKKKKNVFLKVVEITVWYEHGQSGVLSALVRFLRWVQVHKTGQGTMAVLRDSPPYNIIYVDMIGFWTIDFYSIIFVSNSIMSILLIFSEPKWCIDYVF